MLPTLLNIAKEKGSVHYLHGGIPDWIGMNHVVTLISHVLRSSQVELADKQKVIVVA